WLANALLPLFDDDEDVGVELAKTAIGEFAPKYQAAYDELMLKKLGLATVNAENTALVTDLLELMTQAGADFTLTFRRLAELADTGWQGDSVAAIADLPESFSDWLQRWYERAALESTTAAQRQQTMLATNPVFIPRNHLIEEAIVAATRSDDFAPFHHLVDVLASPFHYDHKLERYATPPRPEQVVAKPYCGTLQGAEPSTFHRVDIPHVGTRPLHCAPKWSLTKTRAEDESRVLDRRAHVCCRRCDAGRRGARI